MYNIFGGTPSRDAIKRQVYAYLKKGLSPEEADKETRHWYWLRTGEFPGDHLDEVIAEAVRDNPHGLRFYGIHPMDGAGHFFDDEGYDPSNDAGAPPGRGRRGNPSCSPRSHTRRDNYAGPMSRYTRELTLGDLVDVEPEVEAIAAAGGAGGRGRGGLRAGAYPQVPCPRPTQDLKLNTRNRDSAIRSKHIQYGPLNLSDERFWRRLAKHWNTTPRVAKESRCGNCVAFDVSPRMLRCMPGEISDGHGWLGYCWMHHFKCHSARTCRTWASGGPIVDDAVSLDWQRRASGV